MSFQGRNKCLFSCKILCYKFCFPAQKTVHITMELSIHQVEPDQMWWLNLVLLQAEAVLEQKIYTCTWCCQQPPTQNVMACTVTHKPRATNSCKEQFKVCLQYSCADCTRQPQYVDRNGISLENNYRNCCSSHLPLLIPHAFLFMASCTSTSQRELNVVRYRIIQLQLLAEQYLQLKKPSL